MTFRISPLLVTLALLWANTAVATETVRIDVSVSEPAALFDIVDRVSNWRSPAGDFDEDYLSYWTEAVGLTPEDQSAFATYRDLRRRLDEQRRRVSLVETFRTLDFPFPEVTSALREDDQFALAFLSADTWGDLWPLFESRFGKKAAEELKSIFARLRLRFAKVIRRSLFLHAYAARARVALARPEVTTFLNRLPPLFGLPSDDAPVFRVRLAWLPPKTEQTRATMVGDCAVLEIREDIGPRHILDVAVHELVHRLHERMPTERRRRLAWGLLNTPQAEHDGTLAHAASNVLFESLATCVGQGLFAQRFYPEDFDPKRAWYEDSSYDATAKAIKTLVARYLGEGRCLDEDFARAYVAAYETTSEEGRRPDILRRVLIVASTPHLARAVAGHVTRVARPRMLLRFTTSHPEPIAQARATFPAMTMVVVGQQEDVAAFAAGETTVRPQAGPILVYSGNNPLESFRSAWPVSP